MARLGTAVPLRLWGTGEPRMTLTTSDSGKTWEREGGLHMPVTRICYECRNLFILPPCLFIFTLITTTATAVIWDRITAVSVIVIIIF